MTTAPGPSSLMAFLSVSGYRLQQFHFEGFLPRENEARKARLEKVVGFKIPVILMDTPYRLKKLLEELNTIKPDLEIFLGCDLTQETEWLFSGKVSLALAKLPKEKAEFLLMTTPAVRN